VEAIRYNHVVILTSFRRYFFSPQPQRMAEAVAARADDLHRNLMVNFLPVTWDTAALETFFATFGPLESCRVIIDKATQTSKGYGFVNFVNRQDAETCLATAQGLEVEGRRLKIQKAELGKGPPGNASVYVSGFDPQTTTEEELRGLFGTCGAITKVKLIPSQPGRMGVAFVTFEYFAEAQLAVDTLHGTAVPSGGNLTVRIGEQTLRNAQGVPAKAAASPVPQQQLLPSIPQLQALTAAFPGLLPLLNALPFAAAAAQPRHPLAHRTPIIPVQRFQPYPKPAPKRAKRAAPFAPFGVAPGAPSAPNGAEGLFCIFVYGIQGLDEGTLYNLFAPFGTVANCIVQPGKNFGFVNMPQYSQAATAIAHLNGKQLPGMAVPLQVSFKSK